MANAAVCAGKADAGVARHSARAAAVCVGVLAARQGNVARIRPALQPRPSSAANVHGLASGISARGLRKKRQDRLQGGAVPWRVRHIRGCQSRARQCLCPSQPVHHRVSARTACKQRRQRIRYSNRRRRFADIFLPTPLLALPPGPAINFTKEGTGMFSRATLSTPWPALLQTPATRPA